MTGRLIDRVTLFLKSGKGGDGKTSLHSEKFVRKGGPDGGDGGRGGDVVFKVNDSMFTLNHLRNKHHFKAQDGESGRSRKQHGADGADTVIEVPPGTVVLDNEGNEIMDLTEGAYTFLKGGDGGMGNVHFKSSTNRTPRKSTKGYEGESEKVILELRIIADVGLAGKPNAGKSTFLSVVTKASPKIDSYPFTTLRPNLGVYSDDVHSIRIADIPGIIEGASKGRGLGYQFLQHITRVSLIVFIIDITEDDVLETYETLKREIEEYSAKMKNKERLILFNKTDLVSESRISEIKQMDIPVEHTFSSLKNSDTGNIEQMIMEKLYGQDN
ncbi:MAG: GTPase ObgE [bacterium]